MDKELQQLHRKIPTGTLEDSSDTIMERVDGGEEDVFSSKHKDEYLN